MSVTKAAATRKRAARKAGTKTKTTKAKAGSQGKKYCYFFGKGRAEGDAGMRDLLGGKGAGLAGMTNAGIPVPPGFTMTTEVCNIFDEYLQ